MEIKIQLTTTRIADPLPAGLPLGEVGACVEFRGMVRAEEDGKPIAALEYEAYSPMAEAEMRRIVSDLATREPCLCAHVIHRLGVVPVGEAAIYVRIGARHRAEAFALMTAFLDRLKQDVPIWKRRALTGEESKASP
jgi:molybdopterin synthase catalytic subunit